MSAETEPQIKPAYIDRPDPSEPWRYACPECERTNVERTNMRGYRTPGKKFTVGNVGVIEAKRDSEKQFYCRDCQERRLNLLDKKHDTFVQQVMNR